MTCKQTDIGPVTIQTAAKMDDTVTMLKLSIRDSNANVIRECVNNFDYRNCSCTCALYCDSRIDSNVILDSCLQPKLIQ